MEMVRKGWFEIYLEIGLTNGLNLEDDAMRGIKGVTLWVLTWTMEWMLILDKEEMGKGPSGRGERQEAGGELC